MTERHLISLANAEYAVVWAKPRLATIYDPVNHTRRRVLLLDLGFAYNGVPWDFDTADSPGDDGVFRPTRSVYPRGPRSKARQQNIAMIYEYLLDNGPATAREIQENTSVTNIDTLHQWLRDSPCFEIVGARKTRRMPHKIWAAKVEL